MALGDGIRRNIAHVDPSERALLRDALIELNHRFFPGTRTDPIPGGVTWWFKQDEIHQATHVHGGPEFLPWHREIVNRLEQLLRQINPQLSLHYWDWTQDPRNIPNANLGGGTTGNLNLFTPAFMGYGGSSSDVIGEPWLSAGYYVPGAANYRSTDPFDSVNNNPADPPREVVRFVSGSPLALAQDTAILSAADFHDMRLLLESAHNAMHGFVNMGGTHTSFRDPFVFLLHSNVDRLFARWQTDPANPARLVPSTVYGSESGDAGLNGNIEPWSGGTNTRPWAPPENQQVPHTYKDPAIVAPPCYDTNLSSFYVLEAENPFNVSTSRYQVIFNDVPEEETTWRPAVIRVHTCGDVTIRVQPGTEPGAPFAVVALVVVTPYAPVPFADVRIWFQFTAGPVGTAPQTLPAVNTTLHCDENGQDFQFELRANTIHRPTVAVQLALDQSGSMAWAAGTSGATRLQVLKDAAALFANLIQKNNGIGIIRFDQDAYPPNDPTYGGMAITTVINDGFGDATRAAALTVIAAHGAFGNTSVGDGLEMARNQLNTLPAGSYDQRAIVLLTDGLENEPKSIAEVIGLIDDRTYAVGLGNELQVNTTALTALAGSTGGVLLLSGLLSSSLDDQFRLRKFFLQILAGVTNTSIVKDPVGYINTGTRIRIPFPLSEADINCRVILLTDLPIVKLAVETPNGMVITQGNAGSFGVTFDTTSQLQTSRFNLPVAFQAQRIQAGTWYAILEIDAVLYKRLLAGGVEVAGVQGATSALSSKGARYCLSVHSFSNLRMTATISQTGFAPGSTLTLRVSLTEYNLPVAKRAQVTADVEYPDSTHTLLRLAETQPGTFEASLTAIQAGIYRFRIQAEGATYRGTAFTREQLLTAAVFHEIRPPTSDGGAGGRIVGALEKCCRRMGLSLGLIIMLIIVLIVLFLRSG